MNFLDVLPFNHNRPPIHVAPPTIDPTPVTVEDTVGQSACCASDSVCDSACCVSDAVTDTAHMVQNFVNGTGGHDLTTLLGTLAVVAVALALCCWLLLSYRRRLTAEAKA